ncbi:tetratricopeptide repeat protein [Azospirillum sp.]|uniref:tetratricopeptide repeat protein n=1 Tax=Azospirillum sp. TaxID=34012 RepID=UPI002D29E42F|nr:tetratricopeptide repeat protein [Azospirillum sp.]HYD69456.1 tetratricopeptide repeat protein [Azospirillum sp.]
MSAAVQAAALSATDQGRLVAALSDPAAVVPASLALADRLTALGRGSAIAPLLAALLQARMSTGEPGFVRLGEALLDHSLWGEAERLAGGLAASMPVAAGWLSGRLALERGQPDAAGKAFAPVMAAEGWDEKRREAHLRLAIAHLQGRAKQGEIIGASPVAETATPDIDALAADGRLPLAPRARWWLARGALDTAASLLAGVPAAPDADPEAVWLAATVAAQGGRREEALAGWARSLSARPRHAAALFDRGRFRLAWGDDGGIADLEAALTLKPWAGTVALMLAQRRVAREEYDIALKVLDFTLAASDDQPEVVAATLDVLRAKSDRPLALSVGARAVERYPDNGGVWLSWGACLHHFFGRRDAAIVAYRTAQAAPAHTAAARSNLAKLLFDEGDFDTAIALWEEARVAEGASAAIFVNLGQAYLARGDLEEARAVFTAAREREPDNGAALRGLAECALAEGDLDAAQELASRTLDAAPDDARTYLVVAAAHRALGRDGEALKALEAGLRRAAQSLPLHQALWRHLMARRDYEGALRRAAQAAQDKPQEIEYRLMVADTLHAQNRFDVCRTVLEEARAVDRERGGMALIRFLEGRDEWEAALAEARALLEADPDAVRHYGLVAEALYRMERYDEAEAVLRQGVACDPHRLSINRQLVGQLLAQERYDAAVAVARDFLARQKQAPRYALCLEALERANRRDEALVLAEEFLAAEPDSLIARQAVARIAEQERQPERALEVLRQGGALLPGNLRLNVTLIALLVRQERYDEAQGLAQRLLDRFGQVPEAVLVAVTVLVEAGREDEAEAALKQAVAEHPRHRGLWGVWYELLRRRHRDAEANALLEESLTRFPDANENFVWVVREKMRHSDLDGAEKVVGRWERRKPEDWGPQFAHLLIAEKRRDFKRLGQIAHRLGKRWPNEPAILARLSQAASECNQLKRAVELARAALALRPNSLEYLDALAAVHAKAGNFDDYSEIIAKLLKLQGDHCYHQYPSLFFNINCHPDLSAEEIWSYYRDWADKAVSRHLPPVRPHPNSRDPERRLRIGYVSPDFRQHAVALFSEPLLMRHDREQFELFAFAHLEPGAADHFTDRFKSYVDHWIDVTAMSRDEMVRRIRDLRIDILIDLAGHTSNNRLNVLAQRPAPLQGTWVFGAGQTTGLPQIDFLFTDELSVPPDFEPYCAERVARLPWHGLSYRPPAVTPEVSPAPFLKNGFITFGSLARPVRLNRRVFSVWARILNAMPTARLRLEHGAFDEPETRAVLSERFAACGGDPERIVFANTRPYWSIFAEVDIHLDSFPTNSGTTVTEGLWMGVPAIALDSRPIMGRIGGAQLTAVGLRETCLAADEDEYVAKALRLAGDPARLVEIRDTLRTTFQTSSLMDYDGYGRAAALTYRKLWREWCARTQDEAP